MKKCFEKHTLAKILGLIILLCVVLTWFIPAGYFQDTTLVKSEKYFIGLNDLTTIFSTSVNFILDRVIFILVLGGFYAVLSKTEGYKKLVGNIAKKIKGKEVIFTIACAIVIALLTSVMTQSFAILLFIPILLHIMGRAGLNKITSFAATFGAMLVGILGATYGYDGLVLFDAYFSSGLADKTARELTLAFRFIVLIASAALYVFFLFFGVKKSLESKKKSAEESLDEEFILEDAKDKKTKVYPIIVILSLTFIFTILGFTDWAGIFKLNIFNDFHEWLMNLKVGKDFTLMSYLLGASSITAFGSWNLYHISVVLIILTLLTGILYSVKFDDVLTSFGNGAMKSLKPALVVVAVYAVFVTTYMGGIVPTIADKIMHQDAKPQLNIDYNGAGVAFFNIDLDEDGKADVNLINQDTDKDGKCDLNCDTDKDGYPDYNLDFNEDGKVDETDTNISSQLTGYSTLNMDVDGDGKADINISDQFNLGKVVFGSTVINALNTDFGYTGYSMGQYLISSYGASHLKLVFVIFVTIFGLLQFVAPTSLILAYGLTYTDTKYKDWLKYIWRFALGMLCILLIMFIFMMNM